MVARIILSSGLPMSPDPPFVGLSATELRSLLLRLRLYAQWKVRGDASRAVELDPENLALRAVEQTLDGTRRWNRARFDLLKHLTNCIDSYVSHHFESLARRPPLTAVEGDLATGGDAQPSGPEELVSAARDVADLRGFIQRHHPQLAPLLAMVIDRGLSLSDRADAARCLGLDPGDSAQMQRAYRSINRLKQAVLEWRDRGGPGGGT
jgi:hypothetical protein